MLRSLIVGAILTFDASCGAVGHRPLQLLPSPGIYALTERAVTAINVATKASTVAIATGTELGISFISLKTLADGTTDCGKYYYDSHAIDVNERCEAQYWPTILVHEIGHALGLEHNTKDHTAVMYPVTHFMTLEDAAASLATELEAQHAR